MAKIINLNSKRKKLNIGVIIQARMTSSRFPGKSMILLDGKPVIQHVIEKAKKIRPIKHVILAVPDALESEPMLELADYLNIENFCGQETNVLHRYYHAAKYYKLDIIVRITGDCPFINPRVSSEVLQLLLWRKLDYASNVYPFRTYPKGIDTEVFTFDCLEAAFIINKNAFEQEKDLKRKERLLYDQEHVTPWMQRMGDEEEIRSGCVQQRINMSDKNWCVDTPDDIPRLEKMLSKFIIGASKNDN